MREISVKLARITDEGRLEDMDGDAYYLHTAKCAAIASGDPCDCYGPDVLAELLDELDPETEED